ncbi:MAG: PulJ/GspJ family protein [Candidatus Saccharibacteria bacterium]
MILRRLVHNNSGYTLIELLLYVAILGGLLTSITYFFGMVADARVKNQTISEVNDQGTAVMDYMTQTIHNATSITTPATGASGSSLSLVVPTGSLSPTIFDASGAVTIFGYNTIGTSTDSNDSNSMNATQFTASTTGTISTLFAHVATVAASPNNKAQMAIYSGATYPQTLLASSADTVLTASTWNSFSIPSVSVTSGTKYWLAYNTNGLVAGDNNLHNHAGTVNQSMYLTRTYSTWPASWTGTYDNIENSMYTTIAPSGTASVPEIKEGAGTVVPLADSRMQVSGLTFKNLTRSGTSGVVQISFTLARLNPNAHNEYEYQRTFTGTAEVGW